ncbi:MAG: hypothetical protein LBD73_03600 [Deferribacteraceae bacterium]|nr:hypothetical protein [Deferribacteraceae bacterium]
MEQEYLVNPEVTRRFTAAGSMEEIRKLRRERWNSGKSQHSSLIANGEIVFPESERGLL